MDLCCARCAEVTRYVNEEGLCANCDVRDHLAEARAEVKRLREEQAEFRRKIEAMPNTIISRRAKRHVLAALDGERDE